MKDNWRFKALLRTDKRVLCPSMHYVGLMCDIKDVVGSGDQIGLRSQNTEVSLNSVAL